MTVVSGGQPLRVNDSSYEVPCTAPLHQQAYRHRHLALQQQAHWHCGWHRRHATPALPPVQGQSLQSSVSVLVVVCAVILMSTTTAPTARGHPQAEQAVERHPPAYSDLDRVVVSNGSSCTAGHGTNWIVYEDFNG